jgi:hypothetical protein
MGPSRASQTEWTPRHSEPVARGRRPYRTPELIVFGDLRGITLGGSPGISDSGMNNMEDMVFFTNDYNGIP